MQYHIRTMDDLAALAKSFRESEFAAALAQRTQREARYHEGKAAAWGELQGMVLDGMLDISLEVPPKTRTLPPDPNRVAWAITQMTQHDGKIYYVERPLGTEGVWRYWTNNPAQATRYTKEEADKLAPTIRARYQSNLANPTSVEKI